MSHKQNDLYLEDLARAEEDLRDAMESLDNAKKDLEEAIKWRNKLKQDVVEFQEVLERIKNKEA